MIAYLESFGSRLLLSYSKSSSGKRVPAVASNCPSVVPKPLAGRYNVRSELTSRLAIDSTAGSGWLKDTRYPSSVSNASELDSGFVFKDVWLGPGGGQQSIPVETPPVYRLAT